MSWPLVKLGDVATLINGRAYKKAELLNSGSTPVLRVGNFFSNRNWYYSDLILPEDKYCNEGDLLFAWSASFGPKIWDGPRAIYHYHIWKIVVSPVIDKNYLYYLLDSISSEIKSQGNGITMIHTTKGGMEKREIPLPPLPEQQKIAAILDAADRLKQKDQQLIEHYTRLGQALFLEMFGDPVVNPMGWEPIILGECLDDIIGGKSVSGEERLIKPGEKAVIKISAVTSGTFNPNQYKVVGANQMPEILVNPQKGDLLFSRANTREMVGATCIVDRVYENLFLPDKIWRLDLKPSKAFNWYIKFLLTHEGFRENLRKVATGTSGSMLNISKAKLKQLEVPLAPIELQNQFAQHIEAIEQQKRQAQASLEKSEELFNSLLQRAFKGELTG